MNDLICISNLSKDQERSNRKIGRYMLLFNTAMIIVYVAMFLTGIMNVFVAFMMVCVSLCGILFGFYMLSEAMVYKFIGDTTDDILFKIKTYGKRENKERESVLHIEGQGAETNGYGSLHE